MISPDQIRLTSSFIQQHPAAGRRQILAALTEKAITATRDLLVTVSSLATFDPGDDPIRRAIEKHTRFLVDMGHAATRARHRIDQVRELIGDDAALLAELEEAQILADATASLVTSLGTAWTLRQAHLLQAEELRPLRLQKLLEAVTPLLDTAAVQQEAA